MFWDISPAGVAGVVTRTASAVSDLEATGAAIEAALTGVVGAASSPTVGNAVESLLSGQVRPAVAAAVQRGEACQTAAAQATAAYEQGQQQMAQAAQAAAASAPDPTASMPGSGAR